MKDFSTIIQPVMTEKSVKMQGDLKKYTFLVQNKATKIDVKHAIKTIYGADVKSVRMIVLPSKKRMIGRGRLMKKRGITKKAIVTLAKDQTIDPNKISIKNTKKK